MGDKKEERRAGGREIFKDERGKVRKKDISLMQKQRNRDRNYKWSFKK